MAVDSRVTLPITKPGNLIVAATYDNATKLLTISSQRYVAAIVYGGAVLDRNQPRTIHGYLPEFEQTLPAERLSVKEFAERLGAFFLDRWNAVPQGQRGDPVAFIVGGYDANEAYGRAYGVTVPDSPAPQEYLADQFGAQWAGQKDVATALLQNAAIPWQLLPLQDCIDVAILAVRTTAELQKFLADVRGVGGHIDIAVITKVEGLTIVQSKTIRGERGQ